MSLTSHRLNFSDQMGLAVRYLGENVQKMFAFGNGGSMLVTDLYKTLDEPVQRWGNRIDTGDKTMRFSAPYKAGQDDSTARRPYAPNRALGKQAVLEYGTGYICGMLERGAEPPAPILAPKGPEKLSEKQGDISDNNEGMEIL
jgi:hypothetical protein